MKLKQRAKNVKKSVIFGIAFIAVIMMVGFGVWYIRNLWPTYSGTPESVTLGIMANAGDTFIFIAAEKKYFKSNGIQAALKTSDNGLAATNGMLKGQADLAYATEFVVVGKALQRADISIVATYSKNETIVLAGRKDKGIENIPDLRGKRIGLARGTINEFYLGRLLHLHGLEIGDVSLVDIKTPHLGKALISGNVTAVMAGSRNIYPIIKQLGSTVFTWSAHSDQPAYGNLVGRKDWVSQHPELVKRLLRALAQAENYVIRNPLKARESVQKRLKFDEAYMDSVWSEYHFSLTLDQSLVLAMEDEARWMIKNNLTSEKQVPNFLEYIYEDALKDIKPEAVNIIR